jgi:hypothetical protein
MTGDRTATRRELILLSYPWGETARAGTPPGPGGWFVAGTQIPVPCLQHSAPGCDRQFELADAAGARCAPVPARQVSRVVQSDKLLQPTLLVPDDDGDFTSGALLFAVPEATGRFSFLWEKVHVATFTKAGRDTLTETR